MTAKKRWFTKAYNSQSQGNSITNDISISWSSSEEDEVPLLKRLKTETTFSDRKCTEWIKHFNSSSYSKTGQAMPQQGNRIIFTCTESRKQIDPDDSPIISKTNEWSPVLTQNNKSSTEKSSPVLDKSRRILRKVKCRLNDELRISQRKSQSKDPEIGDESPDLFSTQSSEVVCIAHDDSHSDLLARQYSQVVIEDTQTTVKSLNKIEPPLTQDSSEVLINSRSDKVSSNSEECLLNCNQRPMRKKRYKRGGLCSQLQRVVRTQRARVAIWQHERFLNRNDSFLNENKSSISFTIKKQWNEFGCILCECIYCYDNNEIKNSQASRSDSYTFRTEQVFILVLGFTVVPNIKYVTNSKYILYPPYSKKGIVYENRVASCYFNVSKIQKCKSS